MLVYLLVLLWGMPIQGTVGNEVSTNFGNADIVTPQSGQMEDDKIHELKAESASNVKFFHISLTILLMAFVFYSIYETRKLKKAQNALLASEKKFRMLAEKSTDVVWASDLNMTLSYISPSTEQMLGYPREVRMKMSLGEIFTPDSVELLNRVLNRNLKTYQETGKPTDPFVVELQGLHKRGHEIWVELSADFSYDSNNKIVGLHGLARDISARKEAEFKMLELVDDLKARDKALLHQNEELKIAQKKIENTAAQYIDLFENSPMAYLVLNEKGIVIQANQISAKYINKPKDEILHVAFTEFLQEDSSIFSQKLVDAIHQNQNQEHEFVIAGKHVKIVFVPDTVSGSQNCRLAIVDITEEFEVRENLSLSLTSLQTIFDAIPGGISVIDTNFQITNINDKLMKLHNIKKSTDVIGKKCFEAFNCSAYPCESCVLKQVVESGKTIVRNSSGKDPLYKNGYYRIYSSPVFDSNKKVSGIIETVIDISDFHKAKAALIESEKKFKNLFNDIPDAVFITRIGDRSGEIVDVNTAAIKQTGYTREELLGMNILTDISEYAIKGEITSFREKNLLADEKIELTERKRRKDGTYIWTEVIVQKIFIHGKDMALSVSRDITERVTIKKSLQSSEARVRSLLNALPDTLFIFDEQGVFVEYHSDTSEKLFLPSTPFLNKNVSEVLPAELAELTHKKIKETLHTGEMQTYNYSIDLPTGKSFFNARMVKTSGNKVLTIVRDVTGTLKAEKAKNQNQEKYKTLFRNTPVGIFNFDKDSVILDCNDHFVKIIGSSRQLLIGFNMLENIVDNELKKIITKAINEGSGFYEGYYRSVTANKLTPLKGFFKCIYDNDGNFVDGIGIIEDITEQKRYEKNLVAARKSAEQSDKLKSSFMATMSHELRTPLNTVIGFSDMIEEGMPIDQILEFTQVVSKSGRHLLSIIEDILDISLIDSGEAKLAMERFMLSDMVDGLYAIASQEKIALNKDQIDIKLNFPESLIDVRLSGDVRKIIKIYSHLVKNALKFTKEGRVEIGVKTENISGKAENILFYVKDTGIGIHQDKQQIIFEVFRQADDSSTREFEGTGLGLSISKKLINMMGGTIWVESIPNKGSTFFFELPCLLSIAKAIDVLHKDDKTQHKAAFGHTILVAEDDDTNFHLFKLLLNRKKIDVIRALNGREAIKAVVEQSRINLVLMDINMPVMNGYDATREIKNLRADLPVIALTAYAMASDMVKASEAGCDDYITKPINNVIFYETIMKYLVLDEV